MCGGARCTYHDCKSFYQKEDWFILKVPVESGVGDALLEASGLVRPR